MSSFGRKVFSVAGVAALAVTAACNRGPDLDEVKPGTEVTLTSKDGGVVQGPVEKVEPQSVVVRVGERSKTVPRAEIADVQVAEDGQPEAPLPPTAKYREYVVAEGTVLSVRLNSAVASDTSHEEDTVTGELSDAVRVDGDVVLPDGATLTGTVLRAEPSGKVKGRASLSIRFDTIRAYDESHPVSLTFSQTAESTKADDAKKIGIPAAGGAVIGGILGGKKGAVVGGAVGGGAGTAVVLSTSGKEVRIPAGTILKMTLDRDIDVKVEIKK
jgi:hypothetical protein